MTSETHIKRRHYARSSSFQMALLFTVFCGLAVFVLGYFTYYFTRGHFIHSTEQIIDTEIKYALSQPQIPPAQTRDASRLYLEFSRDSGPPDIMATEVSRLQEGIIVFRHADNQRLYAAKIHTLNSGKFLLVGVDITEVEADFRFMRWLSIVSIILIALVVLGSYVISVFVVRGTNNIANTALDIIETGDLSQRIDMDARWNDLGHMAGVLNQLLERIEELLTGVRRVSDNIAHDLRTPLTRMRSRLEELRDKAPDNENYLALQNEVESLLAVFNALMRIARIETEKKRSHFDTVDLAALLEDVVSFYEPLAQDKNIDLAHDLKSADMHGDRDLLFQAYANILDNAIKFTPQGGRIEIVLRQNAEGIRVSVADSGHGIADADKGRVFGRFYRSDEARSSAGTGLGLSLVLAVVDLHGHRRVMRHAALLWA
jgi:signal transduction histidine kinase